MVKRRFDEPNKLVSSVDRFIQRQKLPLPKRYMPPGSAGAGDAGGYMGADYKSPMASARGIPPPPYRSPMEDVKGVPSPGYRSPMEGVQGVPKVPRPKTGIAPPIPRPKPAQAAAKAAAPIPRAKPKVTVSPTVGKSKSVSPGSGIGTMEELRQRKINAKRGGGRPGYEK